jgi:hypothetical protein
MIRYGSEDCNHVWRYRKDSWEEGCVPAVCVECGAFDCACVVFDNVSRKEFEKVKRIFFDAGINYDANINGKWINPYVKKDENEVDTI